MGSTRAAEIIVEELNLPVTPQDYLDQVKKLLSQRLCDAKIMPGNYTYISFIKN